LLAMTLPQVKHLTGMIILLSVSDCCIMPLFLNQFLKIKEIM